MRLFFKLLISILVIFSCVLLIFVGIIKSKKTFYYSVNGACLPHNYVEEKGKRYRVGAAYIGWGNYRIGIDSDKYVRRPIQNILAHDWLSPQPGFEVLSSGKKPYFQYQTRNQFTSW